MIEQVVSDDLLLAASERGLMEGDYLLQKKRPSLHVAPTPALKDSTIQERSPAPFLLY
jgi:hypothetical protein